MTKKKRAKDSAKRNGGWTEYGFQFTSKLDPNDSSWRAIPTKVIPNPTREDRVDAILKVRRCMPLPTTGEAGRIPNDAMREEVLRSYMMKKLMCDAGGWFAQRWHDLVRERGEARRERELEEQRPARELRNAQGNVQYLLRKVEELSAVDAQKKVKGMSVEDLCKLHNQLVKKRDAREKAAEVILEVER